MSRHSSATAEWDAKEGTKIDGRKSNFNFKRYTGVSAMQIKQCGRAVTSRTCDGGQMYFNATSDSHILAICNSENAPVSSKPP